MDLTQTPVFSRQTWEIAGFDAWSSDLRAVCGHFRPVAATPASGVRGMARRVDLSGLTFAHVVNDLQAITRTSADIRQDDGENLFLLMQLEGACGVEQNEARIMLGAGDCTLVDSARPLAFQFGGAVSNHISLHLPRGALLGRHVAKPGAIRRLDALDPMAIVLRALVAKLASQPAEAAGPLRELLFDAAGQAFLLSPSVPQAPSNRLQQTFLLIDQHLQAPELTPSWLAARLGVSLRTLQDDFRPTGQTCTEAIREKRLCWVEARLRRGAGRNGETIAALAFAAGFNDISYFNRSFRARFGCAPGERQARR